jgi:DNA invertase Pin-like site-specific DNA recombinase
MANMVATFAQLERRLISQRTKEALAMKKAAGVRLGRPPTVPKAVVRRIQRQRARGDTLRPIADGLNRDDRTGRRAVVCGHHSRDPRAVSLILAEGVPLPRRRIVKSGA